MLYIMLDPYRTNGSGDFGETKEDLYQEWAEGIANLVKDVRSQASIDGFEILENGAVSYERFTGPVEAMYWRDGLVHLITAIGDITVKKDW